jgi:hypothetical protein
LSPPETPVEDENSRKNVEIGEIEGEKPAFDDDVDPS